MIDRSGMPGSDSLTHDEIDGNAVLRVNHHQPTETGRAAQHAVNSLIIDHEGVGIGHKQLKGRYTRRDHLVHRLFRRSSKVSNAGVEAVVDGSSAIGLLMPCLYRLRQGLAALLIGKIENGGGATTGGGNGSRLKIVAANG